MQEWITNIRDQCLRAKVPFFFKQWDGVHTSACGTCAGESREAGGENSRRKNVG
ncbi:MAG TPA: DUF5131 family protein [Anaerolineales bacterium]